MNIDAAIRQLRKRPHLERFYKVHPLAPRPAAIQNPSIFDLDIEYAATTGDLDRIPPWHRHPNGYDFEAAMRECIAERRQRVVVEQCLDCGRNIGFTRTGFCKPCLHLAYAEYDCKQNKRLINKLKKALSHGKN